MPKEISSQIIERYNSLAPELKDALFSGLTSDSISRICDFYHLSDEKADVLTLLVGDVLMGFVHYNDFSKVLTEKMGGNVVVAQSIGKEIDREIFLPLRKFLREVYKPISKEALLASEVAAEKELEMPSFVPEPEPVVVPIKIASEPIVSPGPVLSEKPVLQPEPVKRKSFLPFFKFKKSESVASGSDAGAPIIIGQQAEVKPTLEAPTPLVISFEEVTPQKEKVVSNMEVAMDKKSLEAKLASRPVKIVNFSAPAAEAVRPPEIFPRPKEPALTIKQDTPVVSEIKKEVPPLIQFSSFPADRVNFPPPAVSPNPITPPVAPVSSGKTVPLASTIPTASGASQPDNKPNAVAPSMVAPVSGNKEEKTSAPAEPEKMPEVPPENIVDLRKFKF